MRPLADRSSSKCVRRICSEGGRYQVPRRPIGRSAPHTTTHRSAPAVPASVGDSLSAGPAPPCDLRAVLPPRPPAPLEALRGPRPGARAPVHPTPAVGHRRRLTRRAPPRACPAPRRCGEIPAGRAILQPAAVRGGRRVWAPSPISRSVPRRRRPPSTRPATTACAVPG